MPHLDLSCRNGEQPGIKVSLKIKEQTHVLFKIEVFLKTKEQEVVLFGNTVSRSKS